MKTKVFTWMECCIIKLWTNELFCPRVQSHNKHPLQFSPACHRDYVGFLVGSILFVLFFFCTSACLPISMSHFSIWWVCFRPCAPPSSWSVGAWCGCWPHVTQHSSRIYSSFLPENVHSVTNTATWQSLFYSILIIYIWSNYEYLILVY